MNKKLIGFFTAIVGGVLFFPYITQALEITPVRQAVSIESGKEQVVRLTVTNDSSSRARFKPSVDSFNVTEKGAINYDSQDKATDWIQYDPSPIVLQAGESKTLTYNIQVPEDADTKSHYLVLFISKLNDSPGVSVSSRVGSLLFVHVAGTVRESLVLDEFSFKKKIYFGEDPDLRLSLKNKGSIHLKPSGQITLSNYFDKIIKKKQLEDQLVLPDGVYKRSFSFTDLTWRDTGKITANIYMQYGRSGLPLSAKTSFWYIPKKVLYVATASILLIVVFILILGRKLTNEKKS